MLADIGLFLNPSKSELINLGLDETVLHCKIQCINYILENFSFVKKEDVILLGSPLTSTAIHPQFQHKLSIFKAMTEKLSLLDRHPAYAEGEKESTQVQSQMRHFPLEKGNTVMPSGRLPSLRSRPTISRTALKPADAKARLMMPFKEECRGKRPALKRQERGCRPYMFTMAPLRHLCGSQTGRPRC